VPEDDAEMIAEDLIDFYRRWPELRGVAISLSEKTDLSAMQRNLVQWMIKLLDRVGPMDFEPS
jgi:hypothetical protein